MDADGYPDDNELEQIQAWDWKDKGHLALLDFIKARWWMPDFGWTENRQTMELHLSTGGWSGNESIIYALQQNTMFWAVHWEQSRRGGHYVFDMTRLWTETPPIDSLNL
jgi:hypothetical protein